MSGRGRDPHRRRGFTLIEVLLALTLTALLVGVAGRVALSSLQSRQVVSETLSRLDRDAHALDRIESDLSALLRRPIDEEPVITLAGAPQQTLRLDCLIAALSDPADLHTVHRPATVTYRLIRMPGRAGDLVRTSVDRTDATGMRQEEIVARGVAAFEVLLLVDDKWQRKYTKREQADRPPTAMRVRLTFAESGEEFVRTYKLGDEKRKAN